MVKVYPVIMVTCCPNKHICPAWVYCKRHAQISGSGNQIEGFTVIINMFLGIRLYIPTIYPTHTDALVHYIVVDLRVYPIYSAGLIAWYILESKLGMVD